MATRACPSCGAPDYGTPFCVNCQTPMVRGPSGAIATEASRELELTPVVKAGFIRRLAALAVDWLFISIIADILRLAYTLSFRGVYDTGSYDIAAILSMLLFVLYFTLLTGDGGQTLGKMVLSIRVERTDGLDMDYRRAFLRTLGYFISFFFMTFLGFLWALWDRNNQTWHDKIAGTEVIKV